MRSRDKLYETQFRLRQMRKFAGEYQAGDVRAFHRLRFSFNAFVVAARSVTFVLQKDLRSRHAGFEDWYERSRLPLTRFARLASLRNVVQKEGSHLPLSETEIEDTEGNVHVIVWDHAGDDAEQMVGFTSRLKPKHEIGKYFPSDATEGDLRAWAVTAAVEHLSTLDFRALLTGYKVLSRKLRLDPEGPALTIDEFITLCGEYADALRALVDDAYAAFRTERAGQPGPAGG